jgi:hypothetical protein
MEQQAPAYLDEEYPIVISIINEDHRPLDVLLDVLLQPTEIDDAGGFCCDLYLKLALPYP